MTMKHTCYYKGTCEATPLYEVWMEKSNGVFTYSHLCERHYSELVAGGRNFDYIFNLND